LKSQNDIEYIEQYETPQQDGTTAYGFVIANGQKFTYREVEWAKDKHTKAVVLANTHAGAWDFDILKMPDFDIAKDILIDFDILDFEMPDDLPEYQKEGDNTKYNSDGTEKENPYTVKVEAPIYEAKNEKPTIEMLFNDLRYIELIGEIEKSNISNEEKHFLKIAALRHIVFDYEKIADYYAHSDKYTQNLMENSALVIIDFNKAIELGYVRLSEEVAKQYSIDNQNSIEDDEE
jgi:hypothetical protein